MELLLCLRIQYSILPTLPSNCELTAGKKIIKENFTNWTSENEIIDNFIQEKQLKYEGKDEVFEWIPYSELIDIKDIKANCFATAIWKDGPLYYKEDEKGWIRKSYKKVTLRYLYDINSITDEFINKVKSYSLSDYGNYGISQDIDTKVYILVFKVQYFDHFCKKCSNKYERYCYLCKLCQGNEFKDNFTNWTSGNKIIDNFIQEKQLKYNGNDMVFEWIPYDELIDIKEIKDNCLATAIWKDGPLYYDEYFERKLKRKSLDKVVLRFLYDFKDVNDEFLNKVESYLLYGTKNYGISQNPDTRVYILVFNNKLLYKMCGCNIIDNIIQENQLKYKYGTVFEWIPYDEFIGINELKEYTMAIWSKGPLSTEYDDEYKLHWKRKSCENVCLKYLHNSQDIADKFLIEVNSYLKSERCYGISRNPDAKTYILVLNENYFCNNCIECGNQYDEEYKRWCEICQVNQLKNSFMTWTSGNEKVDEFIQKNQLKISGYNDTVFEWIPYDKFISICEIEKSGFTTAIWKDGPLRYDCSLRKYMRKIIRNEKVLLKYMYDLQNVNTFLNEIVYLIKESYGLTQSPITKDFILVLQLKELFQEMKLNTDYNFSKSNIIFEWIPYNKFNNIEEIGKGGFSTVYSAICNGGLLYYSNSWERKPNTTVALKCLHNSQNFIDEFIKEVKAYPKQKIENILKIYGISQNPNTKDYIMVFEYAEGGNFNNYLNKNYENFDWFNGLKALINTIEGLNKIHQKQMVHHDFHIGNILFTKTDNNYNACISDIGFYRKIDDIDETSIYGVMPYVSPEVLGGNPYTQAADIYSFGMIMYFVATGKQPFDDCDHDEILALNICNGIRPEINDQIIPKCYSNLMKQCWDSNPENRPNSIKVKEMIKLLYNSLDQAFEKKEHHHYETEKQFNETQECRKENLLSIKNSQLTTHVQAIYMSRLLNPFIKNHSK
ncbi:hypothetical protein RclHR1_00810004 [Rhizophagus clarus]|uniref:Protein kinase domain-containing protein n=1 Tax=Rhizophagus clarus TaxID=94130 RepID=A0A2Z6SF03_9GLOM|nr:hypothetical protein RclHR1_00810004 [Rhizophagus clarus]